MRRFLGLAAAVLALAGAATPAGAVERWGIYEIALRGPSSGNPFAEVTLAARFSQGARSVVVDGFYDGEGVYRIRFMPDRTGPAPSQWPFALYKEGLRDGMKFRAEILDTWNMTVTPVPSVFTLKRRDAYTLADAEGRSIALPSHPCLALRIRRLPQ